MKEASPFIRGYLDAESFSKEVARILRSGTASEQFLRALADLFDPPARQKGVFAVKVKRRKKSRPKKPQNFELGRAMIDAMKAKASGEKSVDVAARVGKAFNVSARTAYATWERQRELDAAWEALQKSR